MLKLEQAKLPSQPRDVKVRKKLSVGSLQHRFQLCPNGPAGKLARNENPLERS